VFLQFWLLAGDLLDIRQAKRLFPVLLSFSLMGGLVASVATAVLARSFGTESFLTAATARPGYAPAPSTLSVGWGEAKT